MENEEQSETAHTEIMDATYQALCKYGYASVTMEKIATESGKSKGLLHYHFDSKDDLLAAFLEYLLARFEQDIESIDGTPDEQLDEFINRFVVDSGSDDRQALHLALLELRTDAPFNDRYREQLARNDKIVRETIANIIRDGIDQGVFRSDADPETIARLVLASIDGARTRELTIGDDGYAGAVRDALYDCVIDDLRAETNE